MPAIRDPCAVLGVGLLLRDKGPVTVSWRGRIEVLPRLRIMQERRAGIYRRSNKTSEREQRGYNSRVKTKSREDHVLTECCPSCQHHDHYRQSVVFFETFSEEEPLRNNSEMFSDCSLDCFFGTNDALRPTNDGGKKKNAKNGVALRRSALPQIQRNSTTKIPQHSRTTTRFV